AIPTLVWAIIFVAALGLGPLAGAIALAVHNSGVLGKLYSEFMDSVDQVPLEAMRAVGATKTQLVLYGVLPQ
ncbi:MAG: ABC transporter permease subunit, partial [Desulfobacterales bacterium]|nr:ABC transporter permease subunit [Desulfobacterales bacterium]